MTAYTELYDWIVPDLPMAPLPLVTNAIRDTVIDFCERTLVYRQELQQILVVAPTSTVTTVAALSGATTITVSDAANFVNGSTLTVDLTDGTMWRGHVSGTPVAGVITLDGALNEAVDAGAAVRRLEYLYPVTYPAGLTLAKALQVYLNDNLLDPISQDDLDSEFNTVWDSSTNWRTDVRLPTRYYFPDDNTVALALAPEATGNLRINAALKPTRASTTFPTVIFERDVETIAHGAKAQIMAIPKKPYTDLQNAQYHAGMYNGRVGDARVRVAKAVTRAPLRMHTVYGLR